VAFHAIYVFMLAGVTGEGAVTTPAALEFVCVFFVYSITAGSWTRLKRCCTSKRKEQLRQQLEFNRRQIELNIKRRSDWAIELGPIPGKSPDIRATRASIKSAAPSVLARGLWLRVQQQGDLGAMHWKSDGLAWRFVTLDGEHLRLSATEPSGGDSPCKDSFVAKEPFMSPKEDSDAILVHSLRMGDIQEVLATDHSSLDVTCVSSDTVVGPMMTAGLMHLTVRFVARSEAKRDAVLAELRGWGAKDDLEESCEVIEEEEALAASVPRSPLRRAIQLLALPTILVLEWTVPTCSKPLTRKRWPVTLVASMCWLAITSYLLCFMAGEVRRRFGVDEGLLGLTWLGAGTSLPNFIAAVILARRGRGSTAVSNLLASNIQVVFWALGLPWLVKALLADRGVLEQDLAGAVLPVSAVRSLAAGLLLLAGVLAAQRCRPARAAGYVLIAAHVIFVVYTIFAAQCWIGVG